MHEIIYKLLCFFFPLDNISSGPSFLNDFSLGLLHSCCSIICLHYYPVKSFKSYFCVGSPVS